MVFTIQSSALQKLEMFTGMETSLNPFSAQHNVQHICQYLFNKLVAYLLHEKVLTLCLRPFITCPQSSTLPQTKIISFQKTNLQSQPGCPTSYLYIALGIPCCLTQPSPCLFSFPLFDWLPYHLSKSMRLSRRVPSPVLDNTFLDHIRPW